MIQPPQSLLRKAVKAGIEYKRSENLNPSQQESLRIKTQNLFKQVTQAMKAKNDDESLIVWEQLNEHVTRQIEWEEGEGRYEASKAEAAKNPAYSKAHGRAIKNEAERNYKAAGNAHKEAAASTKDPRLQEYHEQKAAQMKVALRHKYDLPSAERIRELNERHAAAMSPVGRYGM